MPAPSKALSPFPRLERAATVVSLVRWAEAGLAEVASSCGRLGSGLAASGSSPCGPRAAGEGVDRQDASVGRRLLQLGDATVRRFFLFSREQLLLTSLASPLFSQTLKVL